MESVDAKLARAKKHLTAFEADADAFLKETRPTFIRKTNSDNTRHWLVGCSVDPIPPIELSAIVGDFLSNLRSCLDNLVCALVRTKHSGSRCNGRAFPIFFSEPKDFSWLDKYLGGVPPQAIALINNLQPYLRPMKTRECEPMWILNRLSNRDRHHASNFTVGFHKNLKIDISLRNGQHWTWESEDRVYLGEVQMIPLDFDPSLFDDEAGIKVCGSPKLFFQGTEAWANRPADEILSTCLQYVEEHVIPRFKPFFR